MRSRVIIWTLVGLAVLAFIIFFLPVMRQAQRDKAAGNPAKVTERIISDAEAYDKYVSRSERDADRFSKRVETLKGKIANMTSDQQTILTNLEAKVSEFSAAVAELRNKTTSEDKNAAVTNVRNLRKVIVTMIRDLGGGTTSPSDS
jgi:chaperonin cofactor prefoldin